MKLNKPYTNQEYADLAVYCNKNNCSIVDKGDYLESVANPPAPEPTYAQKRAKAYPPAADYLDAMVKINSGDDTLAADGNAQLQAYYQACLAVKAQYPKN